MRRNIRASILKVWYRFWAVIAVVTILLAILFSAARLLFPLVPGYKIELESLASDALQRPVTIEKITTDWKLFRPRLKLINIKVLAGENEPALLQAEQLILGLDMFGSIIQGTLDVDDISLLGTTLNIYRGKAGDIAVQGIPVYTPATDNDSFQFVIPSILQNRIIRLADINIDYTDEVLGLHYFVPTVDIALDFAAGDAALYLDVGLPEELGDRLEFAIETSGDVESPNDLNGRIFVRGTGLRPANWKQPLWLGKRVQAGQFDASIWIDVEQPKTVRLTGQLTGEDIALALLARKTNTEKEWQAEKLQLDFHAAAGAENIKINIDNWLVKRDGREWPLSSISLSTPRDSDRRLLQGELALRFIRIEDLFPWLAAFTPRFNAIEKAGLKSIRGDVENIYLLWDLSAEEDQIRMQADFDSLQIEGTGRVPSVKGINGKFRAEGLTAALDLETDKLEFDYPYLFRAPLPLTAVNGELQIYRDEQGFIIRSRNLHVNNPDVDSISWFDYQFDISDKSLWVNHYSQFEVFNASSTSRYLPANRMKSQKGIEWLDNAFISGGAKNGEFTLRGPARKMPFRNNEGVFRIEFDSVDNVLNIWEPGPYATDIVAHAVFDGPSMSIFGYETKVLDSRVQDVTVQIDDMLHSDLLINASLYGSTEDALEYIKQSEARNAFGTVIDQVSATGLHATELDLYIPLHNDKRAPEDRGKAGFGINGNLYGSEVYFNDWKLQFSDLNNNIHITENSVSAQAFSCLLNDQPVEIDINSENIKDERITTTSLSGNVSLNNFLKSIDQPVAQFVDGRSQVYADLELHLTRNPDSKKRNPLLKVSTNLKGARINLPEPLAKPEDTVADLQLSIEFANQVSYSQFEYSGWINGKIRSEITDDRYSISHADIRMNSGKPDLLVKPGIHIRGYVPTIDLDQWRSLTWVKKSSGSVIDIVQQVSVNADKFTYLNRTVENINLGLNRTKHNWKLNLNSEVLRGEVLIPIEGFKKRGLSIDLQYADYDRISMVESDKQAAPADLPPFRLSVDNLIFNKWNLSGLSMLADKTENTVKLHSIRIADQAVGLTGEGEWSVDRNGNHLTKVQLKFNSNDVGKGLGMFNFADLVDGGVGSAEFDLHWNAPPSGFDLGILQGSATIDVEDGQVLELDPGKGRIFGLLNLQSIPRRLSMDFRDLFKEGYVFDEMNGTFSFSDGNAYSSNYQIDGPVGKIDIRGRTGLLQQDYDQQVRFRPELSSSLPVIGALLGGSSGGWAMVIVDSMTRIFGGDTDDLAQARYTVTGPWSNPQITRIKRPRNADGNNRRNKTQSKGGTTKTRASTHQDKKAQP